jgi:multiple sugar transport system substrate-binding protein
MVWLMVRRVDNYANIHGLLEASVKGEIKIEDYISQMDKLANQKYQEANEAIGQ